MKALLAAMLAVPTAAAPVEDVRLRGRILGSDGVPAANLDVAVTAGPGAAGTVFGLFGAGRYQFLFPQAHEVGVETDTDYVLQVASSRGATASYELALIDAVHDAPELRLWGPLVEIDERDGRTTVAFDALDGGEVRVLFLIGSRDVRRSRTIYHRRFRSAPRPWRGADVPPWGAETSADGQTWSPLPRDGRAGGRPVRFVRLADAGGVSEVSVWPAPPARPASETAAPDGGGSRAGGAGDEGEDRRGPLAAVAAVLLAAVGAALARRRPA